MKLNRLWIKDWKNLRDFEVNFDESTLATVIVGRNGTGKSNLLEALIFIFRNLDLESPPPFAYELNYLCNGHDIRIVADPQHPTEKQQFIVDGKPITNRQFIVRDEQNYRLYLPRHVFGYYSGLNTRMEELFERHQEIFYEKIIRVTVDSTQVPLRPLFYARLVHSQFALLAFFSKDNPELRNFLTKHLNIVGLDSILFVLHQPDWNSNEGDTRFWRARGLVARLLGQIHELSLAPLNLESRVPLGFRKTSRREFLYLYLSSLEDFRQLASHYSNEQEFFKALESTYISNLIEELRINVVLKNEDGSLTFRELSEGEQQLLMVLGLLRFTREEESLFLLDEPDTHLNPLWSVQYLQMLREIVGDHASSHIIFTSHNPLVLTDLTREQVQILSPYEKETNGHSHTLLRAQIPIEDPKDLDVVSILTNEAFGLRAAVGMERLHDMERQRELADMSRELTIEEQEELAQIRERLAPLYEPLFGDQLRPLYDRLFAQLWRHEEAMENTLDFTPEQIQSQRELAARLIEEMRSKQSQTAQKTLDDTN